MNLLPRLVSCTCCNPLARYRPWLTVPLLIPIHASSTLRLRRTLLQQPVSFANPQEPHKPCRPRSQVLPLPSGQFPVSPLSCVSHFPHHTHFLTHMPRMTPLIPAYPLAGRLYPKHSPFPTRQAILTTTFPPANLFLPVLPLTRPQIMGC